MAPIPFLSRFRKKKKRNIPTASPKQVDRLFAIHRTRLDLGERPLPRIIHVETRSKCNGECDFCAAAVGKDVRSDEIMPDEIIDNLIRQLQDARYPNRLSFYNNNEPFLDDRMPGIIAKARQALPRAYLELKSNGKSLTVDKLYQVFQAGLDALYINDYRTAKQAIAKEHSPSVAKIMEELRASRRFKGHFAETHYFDRVIVSLSRIDVALGSRAGTAPNRSPLEAPQSVPCMRPFEMLTVNPGGLVMLCCEDLMYVEPMGDLNKQGLWEIWSSPEYDVVRRQLLDGDRSCKSTCAKCDYRGYTMEIFEELGVSSHQGGAMI